MKSDMFFVALADSLELNLLVDIQVASVSGRLLAESDFIVVEEDPTGVLFHVRHIVSTGRARAHVRDEGAEAVFGRIRTGQLVRSDTFRLGGRCRLVIQLVEV